MLSELILNLCNFAFPLVLINITHMLYYMKTSKKKKFNQKSEVLKVLVIYLTWHFTLYINIIFILLFT